MLSISPDIVKQFDTDLDKRAVPFSLRADYRKWLRYYLDVRATYHLPDSRPEQVRLFVEKLREKMVPRCVEWVRSSSRLPGANRLVTHPHARRMARMDPAPLFDLALGLTSP